MAGSLIAGDGGRLAFAGAGSRTSGTPIGAGTTLAPEDAGGISGTGGLAVTGVNTDGGGASVTGATSAVNGDAVSGAVSGGLPLADATLRATAGLDSARPVRIAGAATVDTGGQTVRLSGALSGSGGSIADGGGTLALAGVNGYTGGTVIVGGTTVETASDAALGDPSAAVVIERGRLVALDSFTSARAIVVNEGGVLDSNGYTLSLTGPIVMHTAVADTLLFSGSARVIGPLIVDERGLMVPAGSLLRGTGTVSTPTTIAGTLAPGNSPGTLLFTAPVALQPGAVLQLDVDGTGTGTGAGNCSRVLVQGASFTAGGVLRLLLRGITGDATNAYTPPVGQSFRVVEAKGGILGGFSGLEQPAGLLPGSRFDALYTSDAIVLYATPASYADLSPFGLRLTRNQTSTGAALDALRGPAGVRNDPAATTALGTLFAQVPDALPAVLNGLSATVYGDALQAGLERGRLFGDAVSEQLAARRGAAATAATDSLAAGRKYSVWATGLGQTLRVGKDGNTSYGAGGLAAGADVRLGSGWLAGLAVGYSTGRTTSRDTGATADQEMAHVSAYGNWTGERFYADAHAGFSHADVDVRRRLSAFGTSATGEGDGWGVHAGVEVGTHHAFGGWRVQPGVGLRFDELDRGALSESGAGVLGLRVGRDGATSLRSLVGVRAETVLELGGGCRLIPAARLVWSHEFADVSTTTAAAFLGAPEATARARSAKKGRDGALIGLGPVLNTPYGVSAYVKYDANLRSNAAAHAVTGGVRFSW